MYSYAVGSRPVKCSRAHIRPINARPMLSVKRDGQRKTLLTIFVEGRAKSLHSICQILVTLLSKYPLHALCRENVPFTLLSQYPLHALCRENVPFTLWGKISPSLCIEKFIPFTLCSQYSLHSLEPIFPSLCGANLLLIVVVLITYIIKYLVILFNRSRILAAKMNVITALVLASTLFQ